MNSADFETLAKGLAYENETEMFQDLYITRRFSLTQIVSLLGYSLGTVRRRMKSLGMSFRRPGGPNRLGKSKLTAIPDADFEHVLKAASTHNLHKSTLWKEKRRRGLGKSESRKLDQGGAGQLPDPIDQANHGGVDSLQHIPGVDGDPRIRSGEDEEGNLAGEARGDS